MSATQQVGSFSVKMPVDATNLNQVGDLAIRVHAENTATDCKYIVLTAIVLSTFGYTLNAVGSRLCRAYDDWLYYRHVKSCNKN